tara:strand:+ start:33 stop:710 length:678 start_codon:yes stop_codon:yes gene_type:complete
LAKRLSEKQKEEIIKSFTEGKEIDQLSIEFNCTKFTISRNLKKMIGEDRYKELILKSKSSSQLNKQTKSLPSNEETDINKKLASKNYSVEKINKEFTEDQLLSSNSFVEIRPLDLEIDNNSQKDLSSISIFEINLPKVVYMIVDTKIELDIRYLKDYPEWQFLSANELNRKSIEIYQDIKTAKTYCNKDQKVIKVPNANIFKMVAPILKSRGITRIVSDDKLLAL